MGKTDKKRGGAATHHIVVLEYPGAQQAAVLGLVDLLTWASRIHERDGGRRRLTVERIGPRTFPAPSSRPRCVVIPPALSESPPRTTPALGRWLLDQSNRGATLCSVCVGAFLLAELGLLDGRPATTHWGLGSTFAKQFPAVDVDVDRIVIDDGDIITAGGLMAWIDMGLRVVERTLGPSAMLATARFFLVDPGPREQRYYASFLPALDHGDRAVLKVQRMLQRRFAETVTVPEMAKLAGLGERTFMRRFQAATGFKTKEYVQRLRVERARSRLERSQDSLQEIAWLVGYSDPSAFRSVFLEIVGLTPAQYRRRWNGPQ